MAQLGMTPEEYNYWVESLSEAMKLIGQDAKLYQVDVEEKDLYKDLTLQHKEPVKVGCIFEDNPKPILKKYNWLTEDEELPYVAYIVAKDEELKPIEVREHMILEVISVYGIETTRKFLITSVRGNSIDPIAWICKCVPWREKVDFVPETEEVDNSVKEVNDTDFSYLKR